MTRLLAGLGLALAILAGCGPKEDEDTEFGPPKIAFEGKVDPALSGTWASADKGSVLVLGSKGELDLTSTFATPKGKQTSKKSGQWLLDGEKMKLRYGLDDGTEETVAYDFRREGEKMTLSTKTPKLSTSYQRQAK